MIPRSSWRSSIHSHTPYCETEACHCCLYTLSLMLCTSQNRLSGYTIISLTNTMKRIFFANHDNIVNSFRLPCLGDIHSNGSPLKTLFLAQVARKHRLDNAIRRIVHSTLKSRTTYPVSRTGRVVHDGALRRRLGRPLRYLKRRRRTCRI